MKCCNSVCCNAKFETNYSSCTIRSSENICSSSGGAAHETRKTGWNSVYHQNWWFFEFHPPLNANALFCRFFFESHPVYDQTQGSGAVFFFFHTDNSWVAHMIMKTLTSACLLLEFSWQKRRQADKMRTLGASCSSVSSKLTGSCADPPTESIGTHHCPCLQQCHKPWQSCPKSLHIAQTMAICIDLHWILHAPVSID